MATAKVAVLLLLLLFAGATQAYTTISNNILLDTVWTKNGSPYLLTQSIYVHANLTIAPGVEIWSW
jgi:hypothetical protein